MVKGLTMNLNNQPTIDELAHLFAAQKDSHDSHILWISKSGQVHIDCLSTHADEAEFDKNNQNLLAGGYFNIVGNPRFGQHSGGSNVLPGRQFQFAITYRF